MNSSGESGNFENGLEHIVHLMELHGVTCTLQEFHEAVNVGFHRYESRVYDAVHRSMWKSLPLIFNALAAVADKALDGRQQLRLLDVGCGTGLSSTLLLQTILGKSISSITLLDTSPEMIEKARKRLRNFKGKVTTHPGLLNSVDADAFDIVMTSSVLHHIPDLPSFAQAVSRAVRPGGVYINLHDPNADHLNDEDLIRRSKMLVGQAAERRKTLAWRIMNRLRRVVAKDDYIAQVNADLLSRKIIATPLTDNELWLVTDIHAENGRGISLRFLREKLSAFQLLYACSYSFFGKMWSELPEKLQVEEKQLFASGAMSGLELAAVWRKL
jgi:2-polyprenyl-3-methyl-5-hydroxy-6-metoxy-1,4-benzoquinol methylase